MHLLTKSEDRKHENNNNMFYSQWLLSRKRGLGTIWVAAHCHKRLNKNQVKQTDISSSVDKILEDEVPMVTYRILAYLLFGVVRIFSKKVDFLFHDCRDVVKRLSDFAGGKKANKSVEAMRPSYPSITLPQRFELDAFDLEVFIDQDMSSGGDNSFKAYSTIYTPVKDVYSPHFMDIDLDITPSHDMNDLESSPEKLHGSRFSLGECLEPMIFHEAEKGSGADMSSNEGHQTDWEQREKPDVGESAEIVKLLGKERSVEKLRGTNFPLEESLKLKICSNTGKESRVHFPSDVVYQTDGDQKKNLDRRTNVEEPETQVRSCDTQQNVESEEMRLPELTSSPNEITAKRPLSITIDTILNKLPSGSGAVSPDFMAVCTPATKERAGVLKKRKRFFDETVVLSNSVVKHWIDCSSNLVCKRRKAPHTTFHAWRSRTISNLPRSFLEPIIPCSSVAFGSLVSEKKLTKREPVETVEIHINKVIADTPVNQVVAESPLTDRSQEQTSLAPATPVTHSSSLKLQDVRGVSKPGMLEPANSFENIERQWTPNTDQELDVVLDEEINSCSGYTSRKNKCSVRARKVARYLYEKFQDQRRQKGDVPMNLTQVLKGKSRQESARLFYEILALKTRDYIDVRQEKDFGDILVLETPELKNATNVDGCGSGA